MVLSPWKSAASKATTLINRAVTRQPSVLFAPMSTSPALKRSGLLRQVDVVHFHNTYNLMAWGNLAQTPVPAVVFATLHDERALTAGCHAALGHAGPVWLFSDEPDAALEWLKPQVRPDRVVSPPVGSHSLESMLLMSLMRALVIANSTYSRWAAFIGETQGRPVVAPQPSWASDVHEEPRDALLPGWLTLVCRDFL